MKYSFNNYLPYISDSCTRLDIYPNREFAVKLVAEYKSRGTVVLPIHQLVSPDTNYVPNPKVIIEAINHYARTSGKKVMFVGIEAYLVFLNRREQKDFFIGIRNLLEEQKINAHILISRRFAVNAGIENPKYEDAMHLVQFEGKDDEDNDLSIQLISSRWANQSVNTKVLVGALEELGDYVPEGSYCFAMDEMNLPTSNYNCVSVVKNANDAIKTLYGVEASFKEEQADELLCECAVKKLGPIDVLVERFGGEDYLTCEKAPIRLYDLKNDVLWDLYVWLLKSKIRQDTYLYHVLQKNTTADTFLYEYVVSSAKSCMGDKNAKALADERAVVLKKMNTVEPMIAQFVAATENDIRSVTFLNCGTSVETQGLIRRAAGLDITLGLPDAFDAANPTINCYLSPYFDYGIERLTAYFNKLRCFRIKDSIDKAFVEEAYQAEVPSEIEKRDSLLSKFDDGETALLVVDGLGAEYLPLLINMAEMNNLKVAYKQVVSVNLPTSTKFNNINWNNVHRLRDVRQADNISHTGCAKYEKCGYEENLAELLTLFQKTILVRVISGLTDHKRVIVTADHGSSYLAVAAYKAGLVQTIKWENPDDWRYTAVYASKDAPEELEPVYRAECGCFYFVVKGYNRLPKQGGKLYSLHGGATLEERLVPFVVFTNEPASADMKEQDVEQFVENSDFDIL